MRLQKYIYSIANYTIRILLILIISGICLQSMFSTRNSGVHMADSPFRHLLVFILFLIASVFILALQRYLHEKKDFFLIAGKLSKLNLLRLLSVLLGAASCLWILVTQFGPVSDQWKIYSIAMQFRENNFSAFVEGGYLFRCPHQTGMVLFYYFLSFFLGIDNYIGIQFINAAALLVIFFFTVKLSGIYWKEDRHIPTAVAIVLMFWPPLLLYVTYLYGLLPGMACSFTAVYMAMKYLETRKYRYIIIAALSMGIATVFKINCLIFMAAICCFLFYDIISTPKKQDKIRSVLFILVMLLAVKGCNQAVTSYGEHLSGYEASAGEAMASYIAMGLQDGSNGPGTYNGYIGTVFTKYHYDTKKITQNSFLDIKKTLIRMIENPHDEGLPFFAQKTAVQWNEPAFGGWTISKNRPSSVVPSDFVQSIIYGNIGTLLFRILNYVYTLLLLGALYCLIRRFRSQNLYELFGGVIFLGGFLFHFFWEASPTYTLPYFIALIPYAVKGWMDMVYEADRILLHKLRRSESGSSPSGKRKWKTAYIISAAAAALFLILLIAFSRTNLFNKTIRLDNSGDMKVEQSSPPLQTGPSDAYYLIAPYQSPNYALISQDGLIKTASATGALAQKTAIATKEETSILRFRGTEEVLAVLPEKNYSVISYKDDVKNMFYDDSITADYEWKLKNTADGKGYYILMNGYALTYDNEKNLVSLTAFSRTDSQKWLLIP